MNTDITGTVMGGMLKLDEPLSLPDESRVRVTIHPETPSENSNANPNEGLRKALVALERLRKEHPIRAGVHYTRDELYERG